ncbi:MAG: hypothetical protein ABFC38_14755 [Methanospirillum sp.]
MTVDGGVASGRPDPRTMEVLGEFFESSPGRVLLREVLDWIAAEETAGRERGAVRRGRSCRTSAKTRPRRLRQ